MKNKDEVILRIPPEFAEQLAKTNEYKGLHHYAHDDELHRIIWIFQKPILELSTAPSLSGSPPPTAHIN